MPLVLPAAIYRCILLTVTLQWVANADKLISENNYLLKTVGRRRREPAIWGEPAPDYSEAVLDEFTRYLKALLFVDKKILNHYRNDMTAVKAEIIKTVKEANDYFYQVNVRVTVVDVLEINKPNLTLHLFEEYRRSKLQKLPEHDFAALMSYRYGGGLAFVGGMCTTKAVMLCGYYPQKPEGMGIIFFHEVAHLIGVPHRNQSTSRQVSNCSCQSSPSSKSTHKGCLKIPGFDDDCTLQELVNLLKTKQCLHKTEANAEPLIAKHSLQICGNGIIEGDEECDCGLRKYCNQWNCKPNSCKVVIKSWQMYLLAVSLCLLVLFIVIVWLSISWQRYYRFGDKFNFCTEKIASVFVFVKRNCYKPYFSNVQHNFSQKLQILKNERLYPASTTKIDKRSIVTMVGSQAVTTTLSRQHSNRSTKLHSLPRPSVPPPPPPPSSSSAAKTESLNNSNQLSANKASISKSVKNQSPPPPLPFKPEYLRATSPIQLLNDFLLASGLKTMSDTNQKPSDFVDSRSVEEEKDEIAAKFDEFDEDLDTEERIYVFKQPYSSTDLEENVSFTEDSWRRSCEVNDAAVQSENCVSPLRVPLEEIQLLGRMDMQRLNIKIPETSSDSQLSRDLSKSLADYRQKTHQNNTQIHKTPSRNHSFKVSGLQALKLPELVSPLNKRLAQIDIPKFFANKAFKSSF